MKVFFLSLGILFSVYAADLIFLVVVSLVARRWEKTTLQQEKPQTPRMQEMKEGVAVPSASKEELTSDSANSMNDLAPKVLIQLPMYNEEACCDLIVERCCRIRWPHDKLLIQVLDDSTKEHVRQKVDQAALAAAEQGQRVQVLRRENRQGFKAGALMAGLEAVAREKFVYVAVFDADFEPPEDFLYQTVSHLQRQPTLGFVQTRWVFSNVGTFLTWAQQINLNFHFEVEQRARSYLRWFFNFNGTAGTWRLQCIQDAGGWESDTVVEDMDLSLRAYLHGWEGLYLDHVHCPNELPASLAVYKTQQFRWLAGPMQILLKSFHMIWSSNKINAWKKLNCYWFFARYIMFAAITVAMLAVPPAVLLFERWTWAWEQIFFMVAVNTATVVYFYITPLAIVYMLFSVVTGYFKAWAMMSGLLGSKKSRTWKVTQKLGVSSKRSLRVHKPYALEMLLCVYYGVACFACYWYSSWLFLGYCGIMALCFLVVAFGDHYM